MATVAPVFAVVGMVSSVVVGAFAMVTVTAVHVSLLTSQATRIVTRKP